MQRPYATGYLLAVALFLVCCWVNPNNAIPYRSRPRAKVQVDQRVGNTAEARAVNGVHHVIGQPELGADKISSVSGGGKKWRTSQRFRSPRSRIKNVNVNMNTYGSGRVSQSTGGSHKIDQSTHRSPNIDDVATVRAVHEVSKTNMESTLIAKTINCSESHNPNDRYSSSFNGNSTRKALSVGDDFQVAGEAGTKRTTSVHVGEDITLCWIETTTIKEDRSLHPVQRFVIREYTISFENSATIPERYLECIQLEGEIDRKNNSVPRSALFEIMDEDTRHSHVVNFTTVSHSDGLTVWQHKRVRCGVGPVVTKNIIEWADESLDNTKKRVEIKVSPKLHRLTAQPTDTEPCTTDLVDPGLTSSTPTNPPSPVDYGPGIMCEDLNDCVDEYHGYGTTSIGGSTSSDLHDVTTQSYVTPSAGDGERDKLSNPTDDNESSELLSADGMKMVTPEKINSSEEMTTPISVNNELRLVDDGLSTKTPTEVTTSVDDESQTTTPDFEILSSTESGSVLSVTLIHRTNNSMEIGNQEVEIPEISEELNFSTSEIDNSCESGDVCADLFSEDSTSSWENLSNSEMETSDTVTRRDGETDDSEEFIATPTIDADESETDYLSEEEWDNTIETTESENSDPVTETIESDVTLAGVMEDENILTEIVDRGFTSTETTGNNTMDSTVELTTLIECDPSSDDCLKSFDITTNEDQTESTENLFESTTMQMMTTTKVTDETPAPGSKINMHIKENKTEFDLHEVITTEVSTAEGGGMDEDTLNAKFSAVITSEISTTDESTPQMPLSASCESSEDCDSGFEGDIRGATTEVTTTALRGEALAEEITTTISNATPEMTEPETRLGGESTTDQTTTDISGATTEMIRSLTTLEEEAFTEKNTTAISNATPEMTEPETRLGGESTTDQTTTDISGATTEMIRSLTTLSEEAFTEKNTTAISDATPEMTEPETRLGGETTTEEITTDSNATVVTTSSTTLSGEARTAEMTTDIGNVTFAVTDPETRLGGETTTEEITADINATEVTTSSTTLSGEARTGKMTTDIGNVTFAVTDPETRLGGESTTEEVTTDISGPTTEVTTPSTTLDRLNEEKTRKENITRISDATTEATESSISVDGQTEFTTDSIAEEITGTVRLMTTEQSDLGTITETIPDTNSTNFGQHNHTPTIVRVIGTTTTTPDTVDESSTETTTNLVTVSGDVGTTTDYFTVPNAEARITEKPATFHSCDPESDSCASKDDSTSASCDENSDNCLIDSSVASTSSCDEELGDCSAGAMSPSTIPCDEKSDDCTIGSSSTLTTECDEKSGSSCTGTSDEQRSVTSADNSEMCNKIITANCMMEPEITELSPMTSSTPFEVENISTTVSDVPTMVDSRKSTTVKVMLRDPNPQHKLALTIKILLEHIDENQKKQKLAEVEKHLLFDEHPDEHGKQSLMKQVRSLNNTVSMRTVQALFNCSSVEKLTGDVGDFAAKYFTLHDDIPQGELLNSNFSHTTDSNVHNPQDLSPRAKREVDTNVKMSLPGVHADIHSGLSHVMTQVPSEYGIDQRSAGMSEETIPRSRLLEVVANPRDERVHTRRKRQTIEDLTIDQRDLPKDLEEVSHWSNERVRRAINGGQVRTVTEFTIYKSP